MGHHSLWVEEDWRSHAEVGWHPTAEGQNKETKHEYRLEVHSHWTKKHGIAEFILNFHQEGLRKTVSLWGLCAPDLSINCDNFFLGGGGGEGS